MKRLLTMAALIGAASLSYGQGVVNFTSGTQILATNATMGGASTGRLAGSATAPSAYYFALLVAPTTQTTVDPSFNGWTFTGNYGSNTAAGRFSGNYTTDPGATVPGYAVSSTANFVIVGWSSNLGYAWPTVLAYWNAGNPGAAATPFPGASFNFGWSGVAPNIVLGGGAIPVPSLMGVAPLPGGFTLGLQTVPEPASIALAGLGVAALMIFRRRK